MKVNTRLQKVCLRSLQLSWTALLGAIGTQALAQTHIDNAATAHERLEEVIVTASPFAKTRDAVNQPVNVLSGAKLREKVGSTLGDTLKGELGLANASFGPGVGMPVIRGQSANRVKVMQDSVDSLDASNASPDHANGIEPLLAERIEVLRGPATLRYGAGAIGGVVNVIDKRVPAEAVDGVEGGLEVRGNSVNDEQVGLFTFDTGLGDSFVLHLDGLYRESNDLSIPGYAAAQHEGEEFHPEDTTKGYVGNTDGEAKSGTVGFSWVGERGFLGLAVNRLENEYGIPAGAHVHAHEEELAHEGESTDVRIDLEQTRYDLKGELDQPFAGFDKASVRIGRNDYQHTEIEVTDEGRAAGTRFTNKGYEARLELVHTPLSLSAGELNGAFGLQHQDRDFAALGEEAFIPQSNIRSTGLFWVEEYAPSDSWSFKLGLRGERQQIDADAGAVTPADSYQHNTFNTSASAHWHYAEHQSVSLSLARAERAPSVEELLSNGAHLATASYDLGNTDLDKERSNNWELGWHLHADDDAAHWFGGVQAQVNLFHNRIDDFIYKRNSGDEVDELSLYRYTQEDATFQGAEAEVSLPMGELFSLRLFGDTVSAQFNDLHGDAADVPRLPPRRIGTEVSFEYQSLSGHLSWIEAAAQNDPGEYEEKTDGYSQLDARLNYTLDPGDSLDGSELLIFLKGNNLLNEEIRQSTSYLRDYAPAGGRGVELGMRFSF